MISVTVNSQACWLLPYAPNTDDDVRLGVTLPVDAKRGLTGASSRRPGAITPVHSLEYSADLTAADFAALRNASLNAQNEPILVPVWPHAYRIGSGTATLSAGLVIAWTEGFATYAINPGSLAGYTYAAPLLYGYLDKPPRQSGLRGTLVTSEISVEEDGPVGYSFAAAAGLLAADTTFNTAGGFAAAVFPFVPEWSKAPVPGTAVVDVERANSGNGRQKATTYYPQLPEQIHRATFKLRTAADAARLLEWWRRRAGVADPHWVALSNGVGKLSVSPAAGATALQFGAAIAPLGPVGYVSLFDPAGNIALGRVASSTSTQINLTAGLATAWDKAWTTVATAMLARHTNAELVLEYRPAESGWMAVCTLQWREVAPEYAPPAGETRGTTLGRLSPAAWFFKIDLDYNGAIASTYLTSWESGATIDGHDWIYNDCAFDRFLKSIDLEDDSGNFTMRWYAGCPFENWMPGQLAARGFLTVCKADSDSSGNLSGFRVLLKGELSRPEFDGPNVRSKVKGWNSLFARSAPVQVISPTCGTYLFKPRCGLALGDWTFNAVVVSVASNSVVIGTITRASGGGMPSGFAAADWFALGWIGWTVGGNPLRDSVLTSTAIGGGQVTLTLARAIIFTVGQVVTVVPGCDRLGQTCRSKFANYPNFRGFEWMPSVSPSFKIPQSAQSGAKK